MADSAAFSHPQWLTFTPVAGNAASYFSTTESAVNWLSTAFLFAFAVATPAVIYALHHGVTLLRPVVHPPGARRRHGPCDPC